MNTIIKQVLVFSLSLFLVIAPTIQQANAASSWSITGAVSAGARTIVSATSGGYKSAVNMMPTAGRLGVMLMRGANMAALLYAAGQLANDGIDHVLDPANNSVRYKKVEKPTTPYSYSVQGRKPFSTIEAACREFIVDWESRTYMGLSYGSSFLDGSLYVGQTFKCKVLRDGVQYDTIIGSVIGSSDIITIKHIPINQVASKVISNAAAGHAASQAATRESAVEMVVTGDFDADLLSGAVPTNDTKPLVPAVPGNRNGNVTHGSAGASGEESDGTMSGAAPGAAADAAQAAADASKKAADAAKDAAKAAQDAATNAADAAKDLINSAVDEAIKDAANKAAADAKTAAEAAKAAADAAANKAAADAKAAKDAADRAVAAANERAAAAERAAADAAADASKSAAEKAAAQAAADAAKAEAAAAKARAEAAEKAAKDAAAAKPEAKPFELPAFCSWAAPVCDAVDWLMKPAPDLGDDAALNIDDTDVMPVSTDINFGGSCPANFEFNGSIFGNSINIVLLDTSKFCGFLSTFVKFPVYAASSLFALYILGGRKDG